LSSFLLELKSEAALAGAAMQVEPPPPTMSPAATRVQNAFQAECVQFFAEVVQIFGVPRSVGQIYGVLYASPAPLSFSDIVERLDISKGSASQGLQLLRSLGAINEAKCEELGAKNKAVSAKRDADTSLSGLGISPSPLTSLPLAGDGTRNARIAYEPELSLRRLVSGVLRERMTPLAATSADRLNRLRELAEQDGEGNDFYLERAKQLNTWRRRLRTVLPVLSALLGPMSKK
jgi:HTH-type transcriptional regulator, glycine betaine synthesis regulator